MDGEQPFHAIPRRASALFPKPHITKEDVNLQIPFTPIFGEGIEYLGRTTDGVLALSNYRFLVSFNDNGFFNIPLASIESVECRDQPMLVIFCKDGPSLRFAFRSNERCQEWLRRLVRVLSAPKQLEDHFAFAYYAWAVEDGGDILQRLSSKQKPVTFMDEVNRLNFNTTNGPWRVSSINSEYQLCRSYPSLLLVPSKISDDDLVAIAKFRASGRIPVVVWRHASNGAVIARSSQPEVGLLGWRSPEDEAYIHALRAACASEFPRKGDTTASQRSVLIIDARSYSHAIVNRARGGGVECNDYYQDCDIEFMNLPNIHVIRKSFQMMRSLYSSPGDNNWHSGLDNTRWLNNIAMLMSSAVVAADAVDKNGRPVLVHCSDGWDRTPQIVSLAQILLDPYYRTVEGFRTLVQREWLDFGHKFGDRCGSTVANEDSNDRSPVFLQWLDCVHQLQLQFPCSFEYSELYLLRLLRHTYSNLFGTFLGNSSGDRHNMKISERTFSVWPLLQDDKFINFLFVETPEVLQPSCDVRDMVPWAKVFQGEPERSSKPSSEILGFQVSDDGDATNQNAREEALVPPPSLSVPKQNGHQTVMEPELGEDETEESNHFEDKAANGTDETDMSIDNAAISAIRMPERKNRTISEELCERYSFCESIVTLGDISLSDPSQNNFENDENRSHMNGHNVSNGGIPNSLAVTFDVDGFETNMDPVQVRIRHIMMEDRKRLAAVTLELQLARNQLLASSTTIDHIVKPPPPLTESTESNQSRKEVQPTLWVPDHAVSACKKCSSPFWIGRRKHHCRKCGHIFCAECSEHSAILPEQDLYFPVRICNTCRDDISYCSCCPTSGVNSVNCETQCVKNELDKYEVGVVKNELEKYEVGVVTNELEKYEVGVQVGVVTNELEKYEVGVVKNELERFEVGVAINEHEKYEVGIRNEVQIVNNELEKCKVDGPNKVEEKPTENASSLSSSVRDEISTQKEDIETLPVQPSTGQLSPISILPSTSPPSSDDTNLDNVSSSKTPL